MYLKMFGFDEKPFHITPNPRFIFLSKNHKEAFAHLLYGIQQRVGFLSLSGEVGTGKTTVLRTLLGQLEEAEYRVALIINPCLTALELLQTIHREFSLEFDPQGENLVDLHDSLNRFLLQQREVGITVVLVVDEAQNLDPNVLEQLRLLSNLETETEKLIQMVLVGQPELDDVLQRHDLRQLRQRLAVRYRLQPMDVSDSENYVLHRVRVAGCRDTTIFTPKALQQIFRFSRGTPRLINIICDRALLVAYGRDSRSVTRQDVLTAQNELQQGNPARLPRLIPVMCGLLGLMLFSSVVMKLFPAEQSSLSLGSEKQKVVSEPRPKPLPLEENSPSAVVEPVTAERANELRRVISEQSTAESGFAAIFSLVERWQKSLPAKLPAINSRNAMKATLTSMGFDLVEFDGTVQELLTMNAPAILEISLPNVAGKRFLAVSRLLDNRLQTAPPLTESGWLELAELKEIWFGKALVPYLNDQKIPLIDRPNISGNKVKALQQLLSSLEGVDPVASGRYDTQTINLVTHFQQQHLLAPDGRVGAHTLYWLYRETGHEMPRLSDGETQ